MSNLPTNIIIAGVGGQGVVTLTQVLRSMCQDHGFSVQGSVHKGGAQQLGSIHSVLRVFFKPNENYRYFSTQLLDGDLDVMIGLEPWETLRYSRFFSRKTKIISNSKIIPIETERYQSRTYENPNDQLKSLGLNCIVRDFSALAEERFGTKKMLNFVIAEAALAAKLILFSQKELSPAFLATIPRTSEKVKQAILMEGDRHVQLER